MTARRAAPGSGWLVAAAILLSGLSPAAAISPWQGGSSMIPQMATLPKLRLLLLDLPQLLSDPRLQEERP